MTGFRVGQTVIVAFVVVALVALLVVAGCGGGTSRSSGAAATASDTPSVHLGAYDFAGNSDLLTHPDFTLNSTTPAWIGAGYGDCTGHEMSVSFASGGLVLGVKTLKMTLKLPFPAQPTQFQWLAQDTHGNVHVLQVKTGVEPSRLVGVAGGYPAWYWLPRPAAMAAGFIWYRAEGAAAPIRITQDWIMSMSATWRGKNGLVFVRMIEDSNHDGLFQTGWAGPDKRRDIYYSPVAHTFYGTQVTAGGGYVKAP